MDNCLFWVSHDSSDPLQRYVLFTHDHSWLRNIHIRICVFIHAWWSSCLIIFTKVILKYTPHYTNICCIYCVHIYLNVFCNLNIFGKTVVRLDSFLHKFFFFFFNKWFFHVSLQCFVSNQTGYLHWLFFFVSLPTTLAYIIRVLVTEFSWQTFCKWFRRF